MEKPILLVILDGWGYREETHDNAIYHANPATMNTLFQQYPWTTLKASGTAVGTLAGYSGNSQIGHMTIGTGQIIEQPLAGISLALHGSYFYEHTSLEAYLTRLTKQGGNLHIMGLLSDGGIHSHEDHAYALIQKAAEHGITEPILHPFLDGRDTPPRSAEKYLHRLENVLQETDGYIATMTGRFYAMDRDENWQRTLRTYETLTGSLHESYTNLTQRERNWHDVLSYFYNQGTTDEFIPPTRLTDTGYIKDGDGVIFFNFRSDRARQLSALLLNQTNIRPMQTDQAGSQQKRYKLVPAHHYTPRKLSWMVTGITYHPAFDVHPLYTRPTPKHSFADVLNHHGNRFYRIAETEKYAHITYFFNGGKESLYEHETRKLVPSPDVSPYHNVPEMSAKEITDHVLASLEDDPHDIYLINYANPDMIGHTGDFEATKKAVQCTDQQIQRLYEYAHKHDMTLCITADHGNAEDMYHEHKDMPKTSHTCSPVPFIMVSPKEPPDVSQLYGLADIAPYLLAYMNLPVPDEMKYSYTGFTKSDTDT